MRRAPIVLAATVAGLGVVLGYHPRSRALPSTQAPVASAPVPASSGPVRRIAGADVPNQYGDVQVQVTAAGGRIIRVAALRLPSGGTSQQISSFAGPSLAQQALAAQSASIDGVSGATYTSQSYRTSLQSAIDQLQAATTSRAGR